MPWKGTGSLEAVRFARPCVPSGNEGSRINVNWRQTLFCQTRAILQNLIPGNKVVSNRTAISIRRVRNGHLLKALSRLQIRLPSSKTLIDRTLSSGEQTEHMFSDGISASLELTQAHALESITDRALREQEKAHEENQEKLQRHEDKISNLSDDKNRLDNLIEKSASIMEMQKESVERSKATYKDLFGKLQQRPAHKRKIDDKSRKWKRTTSSSDA
eukprot:gb/GECG01009569.1/.p1 GENE.gb/GECG01009569.1/~~gb/GECG01009569.1/.p1  ORF type:complete len:216 (+),score=22.08 gb/GECG01009569.1/:1-648(+)